MSRIRCFSCGSVSTRLQASAKSWTARSSAGACSVPAKSSIRSLNMCSSRLLPQIGSLGVPLLFFASVPLGSPGLRAPFVAAGLAFEFFHPGYRVV